MCFTPISYCGNTKYAFVTIKIVHGQNLLSSITVVSLSLLGYRYPPNLTTHTVVGDMFHTESECQVTDCDSVSYIRWKIVYYMTS